MRSKPRAASLATLWSVGALPAPGTWGSLIGLVLGVLLVRVFEWRVTVPVLIISFGACVAVCDGAERQLRRHDPPSVILDEVWAMGAVVILLPWLIWSVMRLALALALFRFFDIAKPIPLKPLARLPGGWGIMADDAGAAAYTIATLWLLHKLSW